MKRLLIAALVAVFSFPALAEEGCPDHQLPFERLLETWANPDLTWVELDEKAAGALVGFINAQEPPTDWHPIEVYFVYSLSAGAVVFRFEDECVWTTGALHLEELNALLRAAQAGGA